MVSAVSRGYWVHQDFMAVTSISSSGLTSVQSSADLGVRPGQSPLGLGNLGVLELLRR